MTYQGGMIIGPYPMDMTCPYCRANVTTSVTTRPTMNTHFMFILLCILGCICCAPFVYCADQCMAKQHMCPSCGRFIGIYNV